MQVILEDEHAAHGDIVTVSPIAREYEGQAHHMSKAAHSLVNMLNGLDYSMFDGEESPRLTRALHHLILNLEHGGRRKLNSNTYPSRHQDGEVVNVTVPEREQRVCKHCGMTENAICLRHNL